MIVAERKIATLRFFFLKRKEKKFFNLFEQKITFNNLFDMKVKVTKNLLMWSFGDDTSLTINEINILSHLF